MPTSSKFIGTELYVRAFTTLLGNIRKISIIFETVFGFDHLELRTKLHRFLLLEKNYYESRCLNLNKVTLNKRNMA